MPERVPDSPQTSSTLELLAEVIAFLLGLILLFLPLLLVFRYEVEHIVRQIRPGTEVTVGIAVILRTTLRRLLRAGTTNVLRTSLGTFSRATSRTVTRRMARTGTRFLYGLLTVGAVRHDRDSEAPSTWWPVWSTVVGLILGFVGLAASFAAIITQQDLATRLALSEGGRYSVLTLSLFAASPLLVYAALSTSFAWLFRLKIRVHTALDGLLLQAYFSGAGSFLPMTTDIEYIGDDRQRSKIAVCVIVSLYLIHLLLQAMAAPGDATLASLMSSLFLVYCFVYSFPIRPLEGYAIFARSRILWGLLWIPILISFTTTLPDALTNIL
ncbi:hypothetical protein Mal4_56000 [Maioricimonas rarisocia]|uniref:Uncharacterized protein n=1 Tax=Maioricimonas rarisocia TaxID=2528026 RepID=A0A517ZFI1_9PLAN|nr:hypothetical protein [Maioricimonas rarisocia]QDU41235.1 hypothetical protein Mal4_56000 [Maioricimonas rarisocia]